MIATAQKTQRVKAILDELKIADRNPGVCSGDGQWIEDADGKDMVSYDPTTGEVLASVRQATATTYDALIEKSVTAFQSWKTVPAPKRGLVVRDIGLSLIHI